MVMQIAFLVIIAILMFFMIWLVITNLGSQQNYELLKPILGGLGIAAYFIIMWIFAPFQDVEYKTNILIVVDGKKNPIPLHKLIPKAIGLKSYDGYMQLCQTSVNFFNETNIQEKSCFVDLVELTTLLWIASNYPLHWQVERDEFQAVDMGEGSTRTPEGSDKAVERINIYSLLKGNKLAALRSEKNSYVPFDYIYLPKGTKAIYKRISDLDHKITFDNKNMVLDISFIGGSGSIVDRSDLAKKIKNNGFPAEWSERIIVCFKPRIKRLLRWSIPTEKQQKWVTNLAKFYNESFSWEVLKDKIE